MGSADEIRHMFARMSAERKAIIKGLIQLTYFMRGAIQYNDMMAMTYVERQEVSEFIEDRLEQEKDKLYPTY